jgi:hypothetical protein
MARSGSTAPFSALLPAPRQAKRLPGSFLLRDGLPVVLGPDADDADFTCARALADAVAERCGARLAIETHARSEGLGARVELQRDSERGDAYRLRVSRERIEALGSGRAGLRYAVETLGQLIDGRGRIPACAIEDAPRFERRGLLLDVSRGKVPTPETLHALVDWCVHLKLNVLMLYVEHTFRFRRHPEIGSGASRLDAASLRELDAYAAARHVELIPCLQSLGHMERILELPRYAHLAETERRWTLAPTEPRSYELLRDLYEEYLPNFRSGLFHANCDEPFDLGRGRSSARAAELGPGGLYLEHVGRVRELAATLGKRTLIWADVVHDHPERIAEIPRDLVLLDWGYEANHDTERSAVFARHGFEFWVCPGTSSWNALFPRIENACRNIARWAEAGRRHGAHGLLVTDWGDFGHYNLLGNSWLGYAYAAQQAWSGPVSRVRFDRAFARLFFDDASGVTARLYRELGRWHEVGFRVANGSPLQLLYFDDLERSYFVRGAKRSTLLRTLAGLERAREKITAEAQRFRREPLTWEELRLAAEASALALRKALAGLDYLAWREDPDRLDARTRRRLARELDTLATQQRALGRALRRLWLRRSRPSNFEITRRRLAASVRSLRRAAGQLRRGRPPGPLVPHEGFEPQAVMRELRRSVQRSQSSSRRAMPAR